MILYSSSNIKQVELTSFDCMASNFIFEGPWHTKMQCVLQAVSQFEIPKFD